MEPGKPTPRLCQLLVGRRKVEFTVKREAEIRDSGVYEPCQLVDITTYSGTDPSGERFTSLRWEFADPEGELIVTFTSDVISAQSGAGQLFAGILGRDLIPGEKVTKPDLMDVPLRLLVTREKKRNGQLKNNIPEIGHSEVELPDSSVPDTEAPF